MDVLHLYGVIATLMRRESGDSAGEIREMIRSLRRAGYEGDDLEEVAKDAVKRKQAAGMGIELDENGNFNL